MPSAYIETTIPSYYVARTSINLLQAARQASTRQWWDTGCSGLSLFTSLEVLDECARGDKAMASERYKLIHELPLLPATDASIQLAARLIESEIIPAKTASDALHISLASVHGMDYLVTWNFRHIANPFLRKRLRRAISADGFNMPVMCSPEELLQSDENND
jgi:hypothetical protein